MSLYSLILYVFHANNGNSGSFGDQSASPATPSATMYGTATPSPSYYSYPTAVLAGDGSLEVFALDSSKNLRWKRKDSSLSDWLPQNGSFWTIPGIASATSQSIAAINRGGIAVDILIAGIDHDLFHTRQNTPSTKWPSGWDVISGNISTDPAVISWNTDRLDILAIGAAPEYGIFQIYWSSDTDWSDWIRVGSSYSDFTPTLVLWATDQTDILLIEHSMLTHWYWDASSWQSIGLGGSCTSRPAAVSRGPGLIDVFVRGGDAGLWHFSYSNGWTAPTSPDAETAIKAEPHAISCDVRVIDAFAWRDDNALLHKRVIVASDGTETWTPSRGFEVVGDGLTGPPRAVCNGTESIDVFAFLGDGEVGHCRLDGYSASWSPDDGFESLGSVSI